MTTEGAERVMNKESILEVASDDNPCRAWCPSHKKYLDDGKVERRDKLAKQAMVHVRVFGHIVWMESATGFGMND